MNSLTKNKDFIINEVPHKQLGCSVFFFEFFKSMTQKWTTEIVNFFQKCMLYTHICSMQSSNKLNLCIIGRLLCDFKINACKSSNVYRSCMILRFIRAK